MTQHRIYVKGHYREPAKKAADPLQAQIDAARAARMKSALEKTPVLDFAPAEESRRRTILEFLPWFWRKA